MGISTKINILVVDDQTTTRKTVKETLKETGFKNVHDVESGKLALAYLEEKLAGNEKIDLIISDYDMPGMDGTQLYATIRQNEALKDTKFILVSGCSDQSFIVQAVKGGIKSILLKPFSKQDLINELAKLLN